MVSDSVAMDRGSLAAAVGDLEPAVCFGAVMHERHVAAHNRFVYPSAFLRLPLSRIDALRVPLLGIERAAAFSFRRRDHGARDGSPLLPWLHRILDAHGLRHACDGEVVLQTMPRVLGYVFNPVSFFLNYDARGGLASVVAEVNNTYGARLRYVLGPAHRIPSSGRRVGFRHARELFVSPFLHGPRTYELWLDAPLDGDRLAITMHVDTPEGERIFVAHLAGTRRPLTDRALASAAVRYPLMTARVIGLIHLEALKLRLRGVPYRRPGADHRPLDDPRPTTRPVERRR